MRDDETTSASSNGSFIGHKLYRLSAPADYLRTAIDGREGSITPTKLRSNYQRPNTASPYSAHSSASTVIGIGMVSGRLAKRFGQALIQIAEEPVIWRRLRNIRREVVLLQPTNRSIQEADRFYRDLDSITTILTDLMELTKPSRSFSLNADGYPKRIVQEARRSMQLVLRFRGLAFEMYAFNTTSTLVHDALLLLLTSCCETYWLDEDLPAPDLVRQIVDVDTIFRHCGEQLEGTEPEWAKEYMTIFYTRVIPILCDFVSHKIFHEFCTLPDIFDTCAVLDEHLLYIIAVDDHRELLEFAFKFNFPRLLEVVCDLRKSASHVPPWDYSNYDSFVSLLATPHWHMDMKRLLLNQPPDLPEKHSNL